MALSLNKTLALAGLLFACITMSSQQVEDVSNTAEYKDFKDYKDPAQFEKFRKRRNAIGGWQINQLKRGALVVRLKTNQKLIDALNRNGKTQLAEEKRIEQFAINKNTMLAYLDNFNFCKVYFIYSNSSDSLLNGARQGILLDSNLVVNPSIVMTESFYMLAERDYAYNSSIGFVSEDSARFVTEAGNPVKEMAIVIKNKYGHQVKNPFPYFVKEKTTVDAYYDFPVSTAKDGTIYYTANKTYLRDLKDPAKKPVKKKTPEQKGTTVKVKKEFTYEHMAGAVSQLNSELVQYYRASPELGPDKMDQEVRRFLY